MRSNRRLSIPAIFITVQAVLYAGFLALDLTNKGIGTSVTLKYSIILLCFCYALMSASKSTFYLMQTALLFTAISDLFILVLDYYFYGVLTFIVVQELYSLRLLILLSGGRELDGAIGGRGRRITAAFLKRSLLQLLAALAVCLILSLTGVMLEGLLIVSIFYFICILTNVITAFSLVKHRPGTKGNLIYAIGMLLFLLCDINVGLFNLSGFIPMQEEVYAILYSASSILMWTFYAPAQVLIAISSRYEKGRDFDISDKNS